MGIRLLEGGVGAFWGGVCITLGAAKAPRWPVSASELRLPACTHRGGSQTGGREPKSLVKAALTSSERNAAPWPASLRRLLRALESGATRGRGAGGSFELRGSGLPARRRAGT